MRSCLPCLSCVRRAIGEYLSSSAADVVTLQEVWLASDAALLAQLAARGSLRYHHYFQGGIMGGELLTLSKHPILEVLITQKWSRVI